MFLTFVRFTIHNLYSIINSIYILMSSYDGNSYYDYGKTDFCYRSR